MRCPDTRDHRGRPDSRGVARPAAAGRRGGRPFRPGAAVTEGDPATTRSRSSRRSPGARGGRRPASDPSSLYVPIRPALWPGCEADRLLGWSGAELVDEVGEPDQQIRDDELLGDRKLLKEGD